MSASEEVIDIMDTAVLGGSRAGYVYALRGFCGSLMLADDLSKSVFTGRADDGPWAIDWAAHERICGLMRSGTYR